MVLVIYANPEGDAGYRFSSFVLRFTSTSSSRIVANISVESAYIVGLTPSFVDDYTMRDRFGYMSEDVK